MHRQPLLHLLNHYTPIDAAEQRMLADTIRFVEQHEDAFERSLLMGHVTGSAWVLNPEGTHALLIHHYKLDKWVQPGGHCDGDPDVQQVAAKEALEETGQEVSALSGEVFDVDIHAIPERKGVPAHLHYDIRFRFTAPMTAEVLPHNHESKEVRWVPLGQVHKYSAEASVLRMVAKSAQATKL